LQAQNSAPVVLICGCGAAQIPAPARSTQSTRYTCRRCCARIQRQRNIESLLAFRNGRARPNDELSARALEVIEPFEIANSVERME